jgi:putative heme-binding domain-containing protein
MIERLNGRSVALVFATIAMALSSGFAKPLRAQTKNPYEGDAKMAKVGEFEFRANCAFCHGLGAGGSDAEVFNTINNGVPGTAMPPNGATQQGVGMTAEEVWQVVTYIRSVEKKADSKSLGNAEHGRQVFYGTAACGTCHMVNGKGGRLGPDLSGAASGRSTEYLTESLRVPNKRLAQGISEAMKEFSQEYETANVTTADGTKYVGVVLNEDAFTLQILDTRENFHSWEKSSLKSYEKTRQSLMPEYDEKVLPEQDLQDLLAFLAAASGGGK